MRPVRGELLDADGREKKHAEADSSFSQFCDTRLRRQDSLN
jgi:hypothetical protein